MLKFGLLSVLVLVAVTILQGQTQPSAKDYFDSGVAHIRRGDVDAALIDLGKAIELNPRFAGAYYVRGSIRVSQKDFDAALVDFNKALELEPTAPGVEMVYNNRAVVRVLKGDAVGGLSDFNRAISLNPKYAQAYNGRGNIRSSADDLDGGLSDYERAQRGTIRGLKGDIDGAVADMKKGLSLEPNAASEKIREGFPSPFTRINRFVADHPKNARAYQLRAVFRLMQGKRAEAEIDFKTSFELDPKLKSEFEN